MKARFPNSVGVRETRYNVVEDSEFKLKLIARALLKSEQDFTLLGFMDWQRSNNLTKIITHDPNGMEFHFRIHMP